MTFYVLIFGLVVGSFLNVVIYRIPIGRSIIRPRSSCPGCGYVLRWFNLIPVISYIFQKGRCTVCRAGISPHYPVVEILTGLIFLAVYAKYGLTWQTASYLTLSALVIATGFIDLEHKIIPNEITLAGIILGLVFITQTGLISNIEGFLTGGIVFLAIAVISKGNMGGGDIKLAAVMGLFLGIKLLLVALFAAFLLGSVVGVTLLLVGVVKRKDPFPFGPFLTIGSLISILCGQNIIDWYLNRLI